MVVGGERIESQPGRAGLPRHAEETPPGRVGIEIVPFDRLSPVILRFDEDPSAMAVEESSRSQVWVLNRIIRESVEFPQAMLDRGDQKKRKWTCL